MNSEAGKRCVNLMVLFWAVLSVLVLAPLTSAQVPIGYVKDLRGNWSLNAQPLSRGQALPAGGRITFQPSDTLHCFISIADQNGRTIIYKNCDNSGECNRPIVLPNADTSEPSLGRKIYVAVMDMWSRNVGKYVSFISRGGSLQEAVVKREEDKIDLSPAFVNMPNGNYLLRFVPLSHKADNASPALKMVSFVWNHQNPGKLSLKELTPGTYEVQLLNADDKEPLEPGTEAWILVTNTADYEKNHCAYLQAVAITSQWDKDTRPETIRDFLRAYLDYLATAEAK